MRIVLLALLLLALAPAASARIPIETPGNDANHNGNLDEGPVCVWGWDEPCVLQAYECFQPHARNFAIDCR